MRRNVHASYTERNFFVSYTTRHRCIFASYSKEEFSTVQFPQKIAWEAIVHLASYIKFFSFTLYANAFMQAGWFMLSHYHYWFILCTKVYILKISFIYLIYIYLWTYRYSSSCILLLILLNRRYREFIYKENYTKKKNRKREFS